MERWDLYYKDETPSGKTISKRYANMPPGLFHIIVETLVKHTDGTYLVTQRSFSKVESPGKYEGSAGGSVLAGENKISAAIREVKEETNLDISEVNPTYYHIYEDRGVINQGYLAVTSSPKDSIKYKSDETINHKWLTFDELIKFMQTDEYNENHRSRLLPYLKAKTKTPNK